MSPEPVIEQGQEVVAQEPVSQGPCPGEQREVCAGDGSVCKLVRRGITLPSLQVLWLRGRLVRGAARAGSGREGQSPKADHDALLAVHSVCGSGLRLFMGQEGARP